MGRRKKIDHILPVKHGWYVQCRYEAWFPGPVKEFTKWFVFLPTDGPYETEAECKAACKLQKQNVLYIEKATKAKHEFRPYLITEENDPTKKWRELKAQYDEADRKREEIESRRAAKREARKLKQRA